MSDNADVSIMASVKEAVTEYMNKNGCLPAVIFAEAQAFMMLKRGGCEEFPIVVVLGSKKIPVVRVLRDGMNIYLYGAAVPIRTAENYKTVFLQGGGIMDGTNS